MECKELEALNGTYRVYEDGTITSNIRKTKHVHWYEKKHSINSKGYHRVHLCLKDGDSKNYRVHRIVAKLFLSPSNKLDRKFVNHKDGNKDNNHYTNLEWCTHAENMLHAKINGLMKKGEDFNGKPVSITFEFPSAKTAERFFGLSPDVIARRARGETYDSRTHPIVDVHYIGEGKLKLAIEMLQELMKCTEENYKEWASDTGDLWDERLGDDWGHVQEFIEANEVK